jgi:hypothetical protein
MGTFAQSRAVGIRKKEELVCLLAAVKFTAHAKGRDHMNANSLLCQVDEKRIAVLLARNFPAPYGN